MLGIIVFQIARERRLPPLHFLRPAGDGLPIDPRQHLLTRVVFEGRDQRSRLPARLAVGVLRRGGVACTGERNKAGEGDEHERRGTSVKHDQGSA
jgi:hypothetical protein